MFYQTTYKYVFLFNFRFVDDSNLPPELQGLGERYMKICGKGSFAICPDKFPWLGNPFGQ